MHRKQGAAFLPWLFILLMLGSLLWLLNRLNVELGHADTCEKQLKEIYEVLNRYEQQHGRLPALEMFPGNPEESESSLLQVLASFGVAPETAVCPACHPVLREHGLTYLWNPALNHGSIRDDSKAEPQWMLVDMQALDDRIRGPHFGSYHILYTDGRVERSARPPHSLPVEFQ
jgi:hypothetical protein